jgi:hypothetical protein
MYHICLSRQQLTKKASERPAKRPTEGCRVAIAGIEKVQFLPVLSMTRFAVHRLPTSHCMHRQRSTYHRTQMLRFIGMALRPSFLRIFRTRGALSAVGMPLSIGSLRRDLSRTALVRPQALIALLRLNHQIGRSSPEVTSHAAARDCAGRSHLLSMRPWPSFSEPITRPPPGMKRSLLKSRLVEPDF